MSISAAGPRATPFLAPLVAIAAAAFPASIAPAQTICGEWSTPAPNLVGTVRGLCEFQGLTYVGGTFGGTGGTYLTRWDGTTFIPMPQPITSEVRCMAVFDDGAGPALYVGGGAWSFGPFTTHRGVMRWSGQAWTGTNFPQTTSVDVLAVADDGSGPSLYAVPLGGDLFRLTAGQWVAVPDAPGNIKALASFDDGSGLALYAGGQFNLAGSVPARNIARLRAGAWSEVGGGLTHTVAPGSVRSLAVLDLGDGPALYAGGLFNRAGGLPCFCVAAWRPGATWRTFPFTGYSTFNVQGDVIHSLAALRNTDPPLLLAGASWLSSSSPTDQIQGGLLVWDGLRWNSAGPPATSGVNALLVREDPVLPRVLVGGAMPGAVAVSAWSPCPNCYANCDRSTEPPALSVADFACFLSRFSSGAALPAAQQAGHYANCDRSTTAPILNVQDFSCFLARYAGGCP